MVAVSNPHDMTTWKRGGQVSPQRSRHGGITGAATLSVALRISSHGVAGESDVQDEEEEAAEEIMNDPEQQDLTGVPSQRLCKPFSNKV